jgi:hypothetical protein
MASLVASLLLFQIALISPDAASGGDLLPAELGEWRASGAALEKFSPAQVNVFASGADGVALNEFGFFGAQRREYRQGNRTVTVEALRMKDSSAAYGAFTWYRQSGWREESSVAHDTRSFRAAIGPNEAVLQRNGYCIRILGVQPSHKELAQAAAVLPSLEEEPMPSLPAYLPTGGLIHSSAKYAYGPQVFERVVPQVPAMAVGFHMGAEIVAAEYRLPGKPPLTLVVAEYPTPQIARNFAKNIESLNLSTVRVKRSGPLLAIVPNLDAGGDASGAQSAEADHLLAQVNYEMTGTWNEKVPNVKEPTFAQMIMSIFELCGILLVFCVLSGVVYGGIRVFTRSRNPGHGFEGDSGLIGLNLNG